MRLYYTCRYDGKECKKVIPKLDENGYVIQPPNDKIKERYGHFLADFVLNESWDACDKCERNCCMSGCCYGRLKMGD